MADPGHWYKMKRYNTRSAANGTAWRLRNNGYLPPGRWETTIRTEDDGVWMYMRYLGE